MFWEKLELKETDKIIMPKGNLVEKYRCPQCGFCHFFVDNHKNQFNYCPQCGQKLLFD